MGKEFSVDESWQLPNNLRLEWASDDSVIAAIMAASIVLNNGAEDIDGLSNQIDYLKSATPPEVTTQFEKNDKTLKMCSAAQDFDENGDAVMTIKVPGTYGDNVRFISGGELWVSDQHKDDRVLEVAVVDVDNVLGYGVNTVIQTYHDTDVPEEQMGWRIPYKRGQVDAETIGGYGVIPSELYLVIKVKSGHGNATGTAYVNIEWGSQG
jgi:hypothetical protein